VCVFLFVFAVFPCNFGGDSCVNRGIVEINLRNKGTGKSAFQIYPLKRAQSIPSCFLRNLSQESAVIRSAFPFQICATMSCCSSLLLSLTSWSLGASSAIITRDFFGIAPVASITKGRKQIPFVAHKVCHFCCFSSSRILAATKGVSGFCFFPASRRIALLCPGHVTDTSIA